MDIQTMDPQSNKKKWWIVGGIAVVLIIVAVAMYNRSQTVNPPQGIAVGDQNSIVVGDQDPDSVAVLVDDVNLRKAGFIAIYEDVNGRPGGIVATSNVLTAGNHKNVSIIMTLKPGATYYAGLWADDGNGEFNPNNDEPLTENAGDPPRQVMTSFKVNLTSPGGESKG